MASKSYIVIPGTNIRLYDGDTVKISNKPKYNWIVHNGWYIYQGAQNYGWYLVCIETTELLPASVIDLTLCTLVSVKTINSESYDGREVNYTRPFTDADAEVLNRSFITVDTLEQRDNIDPKTLTNGRLIRVNHVDGFPKYYAWNSDTSTWDEVSDASGGIPEAIGTPQNPVILSKLPNGLCRVLGVYLIAPLSDTTTVSTIDHLVFVSNSQGITFIKVITEASITDYQVMDDREVLVDKYAYQSYVDQSLSTLEQQISEIISELTASGIIYNPPASGTTSGSHTVQAAIDALNDAISTGDKEVFYGTTEYWNNQPQFIPIRGCVYIYSDHDTDSEGNPIAGLKIGDGTSYLIDMPFIDKKYAEHILDTAIHVSASDREFWNNKVTCKVDPININTLLISKNNI